MKVEEKVRGKARKNKLISYDGDKEKYQWFHSIINLFYVIFVMLPLWRRPKVTFVWSIGYVDSINPVPVSTPIFPTFLHLIFIPYLLAQSLVISTLSAWMSKDPLMDSI